MQQQIVNDLIKESLKNNNIAFRKLVEGHQSYIFALAFRLLCNEDDAKDIVQETFIRVWKHLHRYNNNIKFSTWIFKITTNLCYDRMKVLKRKKTEQLADLHQLSVMQDIITNNLESNLINRELAQIIEVLTNDLPLKQKLVFTLKDIEGLEVYEIEKITGLNAGKIKSNLYLARQSIKGKLEKL